MLRREAENIRSHEDLSRFVRRLEQDLRDHADEWENVTLSQYLEALSAWISDMDGFYQSVRGGALPETPTWAMVGEMLLAGRIYE
jgi:hypothetical protein